MHQLPGRRQTRLPVSSEEEGRLVTPVDSRQAEESSESPVFRALRAYVQEECARRGLTLDLSVLNSFAAERWQEGDRFARRRLPRLLGRPGREATGSLRRGADLAGVAGHGLYVGTALHTTLCRSDQGREASATACALWNLLVSFFDDLCDIHTDLRPRLFRVISPEALDRALDPRLATSGGSAFSCKPEEDPHLVLVAQLAEALFSHLRSLARISKRRDVWADLRAAIFEVYAAERDSTDLPLARTTDPGQALRVLRGKSSLPSWVAALMVLVADEGDIEYPALRDTMLRLGDLYWLADDIMDLEEDVQARQMNYVVLAAARWEGHEFFDGLLASEIGELPVALLEKGCLRTAVRELFSTYDEVSAQLDRQFGPETPLQQALFPCFSCWFTPLFA